MVQHMEQNFDIPGLAKSITSWLTTTVGSPVRGSFLQAVDCNLTFYFRFFSSGIAPQPSPSSDPSPFAFLP